jgi:hypothetical protein
MTVFKPLFPLIACVLCAGIFSHGNADTAEKLAVTTKISVVFNTLCAKCHEGECSGRLSFDTGSGTAARHIRNYAKDSNLSDSEIQGFFTVLGYMKEKCAIYMPDDGRWRPENLSRFALPSKKGYFIPLGRVEAGRYRLKMELARASPFRAEVMTERIENLLDRFTEGRKRRYLFHFSVEEAATLFLRIRAGESVSLVGLELEKERSGF